MQKTFRFLATAYLPILALALSFASLVGERHWLIAAFFFLPIHLWLLPLLVLLPFGVRWNLASAAAQISSLVAISVFYCTLRWHPRPAPDSLALTIVTNNAGQSNHQSLLPFLTAENPDVIALQEFTRRGDAWRRSFPGRNISEASEFVLISKFPIRKTVLLPAPRWRGAPVAAEFDLEWNGRPLIIYNVHFPTPRLALAKLRGRGLVRELFGRNHCAPDNLSFAETVAARLDLARALSTRLAAEQRPFLVAGDFNMPDHGCVYRLFSGKMTDVFARAGRGWGWTFPGYTHHPLLIFGPWLRFDYVFAGRDFRPVFCHVEPSRASQHRAVSAQLRLR